jgi:hypothetical protein
MAHRCKKLKATGTHALVEPSRHIRSGSDRNVLVHHLIAAGRLARASILATRPSSSPPYNQLPTSARKVTPNPSVKGTACAKAQAAPYLER